VPVSAIDDSIAEFDESVTVSLQGVIHVYTVGTPSSATVLIHDNDTPLVSVETINDAAEGGTDGIFRFTRQGDKSGSLTVSYSLGGTATNGTDFTSLSGTVTFVAGDVTADVDVHALHDGVNDPDETVNMTVTSGTGYTAGSPSSATVNVIDTDILPIAFDDFETTSENAPIVVSALDFATSLYGDTLTITGVTQGANGSVVNNQDGTVTYTPNTGFVGDDSFTYTAEDPFGNAATGTITITVTQPQAPPTSVWTAANTAVTVDVPNLAFDPDGETLTTTAVTQGSHGSVVLNGDGTVTYTPNSNYTGDDSFTYTVEDPNGNTATNTITVTVGSTDPVALDDDATTDVNTAVNVAVLDLASQPAGGSLTTTAVTQGAHGTVTIQADGSVTYTPNTGFSGTDTFTYTVTDANSHTATGTITVTVGTPAPTDVDTIDAALDGISGDIANYTSGSAATIAAAVTGVIPTINTYLANVATFVSTNSIDTVGTNKSFDAFVSAAWSAYKKALYPTYNDALNTEALLWSILVANKNLMDSIAQQRKAEIRKPQPNGIVIDALTREYKTLGQAHDWLIDVWGKVDNQMRNKDSIAADKAWRAIAAGKEPAVQKLLAPPKLPKRDVSDILLK
jgi:hypothetical protein